MIEMESTDDPETIADKTKRESSQQRIGFHWADFTKEKPNSIDERVIAEKERKTGWLKMRKGCDR